MRAIIPTLAIALVIAGCRPTTVANSAGAISTAQAYDLHVFSDRRDPVFEWVYIVRGRELVAQRHRFPGGDSNPNTYRVAVVPEPTWAEVQRCERLAGDLRPPFVPGGPNCIRTDLRLADQRADSAWFTDANPDVTSLYSSLQRAVSGGSERLAVPPPWTASYAFLRSTLRLTGAG